MKKKHVYLYYIILMLFCQCALFGGMASALDGGARAAIVDHCDEIRDNLKTVQKKDRQTRVYLGRIYETILSRFITPLNIRLVENNMSNQSLLLNQSLFAEKRTEFMNDYVAYQQLLEETISLDCKNEPEKFYDSLELTRKGRKVMQKDVVKLRDLITEQVKIVTKLKGEA